MSKNIKKIIVNLITTCRLIFAIILVCLYNKFSSYTFLILMGILFATDFIDGFLARKFKVQTFYGSIMDTLADKILNIALILPLLKEIPLMITILILEVIIALINIIGKIKGKQLRTKYLGKIKMWVVAITIILGYLKIFNIININTYIPVILSNAFQIFAIFDYILYFSKQKTPKSYLSSKSKKELLHKLFDTEFYLKNN